MHNTLLVEIIQISPSCKVVILHSILINGQSLGLPECVRCKCQSTFYARLSTKLIEIFITLTVIPIRCSEIWYSTCNCVWLKMIQFAQFMKQRSQNMDVKILEGLDLFKNTKFEKFEKFLKNTKFLSRKSNRRLLCHWISSKPRTAENFQNFFLYCDILKGYGSIFNLFHVQKKWKSEYSPGSLSYHNKDMLLLILGMTSKVTANSLSLVN